MNEEKVVEGRGSAGGGSHATWTHQKKKSRRFRRETLNLQRGKRSGSLEVMVPCLEVPNHEQVCVLDFFLSLLPKTMYVASTTKPG